MLLSLATFFEPFVFQIAFEAKRFDLILDAIGMTGLVQVALDAAIRAGDAAYAVQFSVSFQSGLGEEVKLFRRRVGEAISVFSEFN